MRFSSLVTRARAVVEALATPEQIPEPEAEPSFEAKLAEVERQFEALRARLKTEERISREYFDVIERIEKERDQWKDMFFTQANEHQNAQALLQKMLADCAANLRGSLSQLNLLRKAAGMEPVITPSMLESLPTDIPEKYGEKVRELAAAALKQTDGSAERRRIAARVSGEVGKNS